LLAHTPAEPTHPRWEQSFESSAENNRGTEHCYLALYVNLGTNLIGAVPWNGGGIGGASSAQGGSIMANMDGTLGGVLTENSITSNSYESTMTFAIKSMLIERSVRKFQIDLEDQFSFKKAGDKKYKNLKWSAMKQIWFLSQFQTQMQKIHRKRAENGMKTKDHSGNSISLTSIRSL